MNYLVAIRYFRIIALFSSSMLAWILVGCNKTEVFPIIMDEITTVAPTVVSIQPTSTNQADVVIKAGFQFGSTAWKLSIYDASGKPVASSEKDTERLPLFALTTYQLTGLLAGQTYRLRMATVNAGGDSVLVNRFYMHQPTGPRWVRLAHAPLVGGDFAGSPLSTDNVPAYTDGRLLSVWRYLNDETWHRLSYSTQTDSWIDSKEATTLCRHGIVRYQLQAVKGVAYLFSGLGFVQNEYLPGQRQYLKDISTPPYAGPDGEVRVFTTLDRAFHLTEGGPTEVWVRRGTWEQYRTTDFPEPTGTLATFRLGSTGYVVNQRPGQPIHLWAFDTEREQWSRLADFPGPARSQGISFHAADKGYFGLGLNANQETLRDLWQYDPATNRWQYVTDYPGQGSIYLTVGQLPSKTLLGWGYEQQPTGVGGIRLMGCTDLWEFRPD